MPQFHDLTVDGTSLRTFGIELNAKGMYKAPERDYDLITIPGRNGELHRDNGRFKNVDVPYQCSIAGSRSGGNVKEKINALRSFLKSRKGYVIIKDTFDESEYRLGVLKGEFDPDVGLRHTWAEFELVFSCKPHRYLVSGDTEITVSAGASAILTNPTLFPASPLITGTGTTAGKTVSVTSGGISYQLKIKSSSKIYIDCELMYSYDSSGNNKSAYVEYTSTRFPVLAADSQSTIVNNTNSVITVKPRWWTI